jgi:hypothetical protein
MRNSSVDREWSEALNAQLVASKLPLSRRPQPLSQWYTTHQIQWGNHGMCRSTRNNTTHSTRCKVRAGEELNLSLRLHRVQFVRHCEYRPRPKYSDRVDDPRFPRIDFVVVSVLARRYLLCEGVACYNAVAK